MSGLYFVQDENNFINLLLRVGSGSNEKSTGSAAAQKSTDPEPHPWLKTASILFRTCVLTCS